MKKFLLLLTLGLSHSLLPVKIQTGVLNNIGNIELDGGEFDLNDFQEELLLSEFTGPEQQHFADKNILKLAINQRTFNLILEMIGDINFFYGLRAGEILRKTSPSEFLQLLVAFDYLMISDNLLLSVVANHYLSIQEKISLDDFVLYEPNIISLFKSVSAQKYLSDAIVPYISLQTLAGNKKSITLVTFSLDGKVLEIRFHDNTTRLWDISSGKYLNEEELPTAKHTHSKVPSLNLETLSTTATSNFTGLDDIGYSRAFYKTEKWPQPVDIDLKLLSPDGSISIVGNSNNIRLIDAENGTDLQKLEKNNSSISAVAFSPDSKILAVGRLNSTIDLWNIESDNCVQTLAGHQNYILSIAFSPDGTLLATASNDGAVKLWSVNLNVLQQMLIMWAMKNPGKLKLGHSAVLDSTYHSLPEQLKKKIIIETVVTRKRSRSQMS